MAHKTRVNGTVYEIGSGKTMAGGTVYTIGGGRVLSGGTAYDLPVGEVTSGDLFTVNITALSSASYVHSVEIHGEVYEDSASVTVADGTVIVLYCLCYFDDPTTGIFVNDEQVAGGEGELYYEYTVRGNVEIEMINYSSMAAIYVFEE